jgi:hypothetical protein
MANERENFVLCPKCKTEHTDRSHRRGLIERGVAVVGYYPYRCRDCHLRFFRMRTEPTVDTATDRPGLEREIKATRGAMGAKRKRRELLLYVTAMVLFLTFLYYLTLERGNSMDGRTAPASGSTSQSA